jgi:23S rRNA G2445 N2-methylase RlmL
MAKPRDPASLRELVKSPSFTPAVRDVDGLAEILADPDDAVVRQAEQALVRAGPGIVPRLLLRLKEATPRARAHGYRVLGSLAPSDAALARELMGGLGDADARVQRAAATALGRLSSSEAIKEIGEALLQSWDEAPPLPLARALAEAMGKLGVAGARERLLAVQDGDPELGRVSRRAEVMLARDESRGEVSEIDGTREADAPVEVVLLCRAGLEEMVETELRERCHGATQTRIGAGRVTALWRGAPQELFLVRTMLGFGFALPALSVRTGETRADACVRLLTSDEARRVLTTWTRGTVRYRLDWHGEGHRRAATWQVVHALEERAPEWLNDPTDSTWQISIEVSETDDGKLTMSALLTPQKLADPRFTYRLRDVPAASHPTLAAALVRASGVREDDVVWDPFVGSGSELIERARAGPYRALFGSDIDPRALDAARANLEAAGLVGVTLSDGDATTYAPPGVTRIVTNPPMGRRVARDGSLAELLDRFTDHAAAVLANGGSVAWLSPMGGRTAERAEAKGFRVTTRQRVDLGGFQAELQVWSMPARP